jgi:porin
MHCVSSRAVLVFAATACWACVLANSNALAGAKDESAAEWIAPKWFNEWHDGLANKGLNFGAIWIGDNIGNATGGVARGAIHFGRFDLFVHAERNWSAGQA